MRWAHDSSVFLINYHLGILGFILKTNHPRILHTHADVDSVFSSLIATLKCCRSILCCQAIHGRVIKSGNYSHGFIGDRLVSKYVKVGRPDDAEKLFDEIPHKDLVSWNSLVSAFSGKGYFLKCLKAMNRMRSEANMRPNKVTLISVSSSCADMQAIEEGKLIHGLVEKMGMFGEVKVFNSLINMYGNSGHFDSARLLFTTMVEKSLVSWNLMISIYAGQGLAMDGILLFNQMRMSGIRPHDSTMVAVLRACEASNAVRLIDATLAVVIKCGFYEHISILTAILNLYAKTGRLNFSEAIFSHINNPDSIAWTAMLSGYASHGRGLDAVKLFDLMVEKGIEPDHVTFTHLLSACSHSGFLTQGKMYFDSMLELYGIEPRVDHYSCMVDLLGRCGLVEEAYELVKKMPVEPNSGVWGALLGACRVHKNVEIGKEAAEKLFSLEPSDRRNYIMLSGMYSAAGMWKEALGVRALMMEKCTLKLPGLSFIDHGNKIH